LANFNGGKVPQRSVILYLKERKSTLSTALRKKKRKKKFLEPDLIVPWNRKKRAEENRNPS